MENISERDDDKIEKYVYSFRLSGKVTYEHKKFNGIMENNVANLNTTFKMKGTLNMDSVSHQIINYGNLVVNDTNANTSVPVTGENVTIIPSSGKHTVGSSKVKLKNLVDYSWEYKFYPGQILAIHISGKYVAYGIQGKEGGIVRVLNLATSERALIKGIEGMTQDVAFAFIISPVLLACIDTGGDVYVYAIEENQLKALSCCLMLHIRQDSSCPSDGINRIVWCPYVPDDEEQLEDDDPSKLIVTRGNKVHLWNVNVVRAQHGITPVTANMVSDGFLEIEIDKYTIVDLAFSPDGSTVALACSDGGIRFFQVDVQEGQSPVCIHDWRPHDGKPVSCLYFLDNHLDSDCHFWKFAVTGVEGNSEIKIWTCETWSCLQTLRYAPDDDSSSSALKLKVAVDITANFILISDMQRKLLHVLQLRKNKEETEVRIDVISEFLLSYPILSFGIVTAKRDYFSDEAIAAFENESKELIIADDNSSIMKTLIKLYLVQPKALHECIIVYDSDDVTIKYNDLKSSVSDHAIITVDNGAIMNGIGQKSENRFSSAALDLKLITPIDLNSTTNSVKVKSMEKYLPVSAMEDRVVIQSKQRVSPAEEYRSDSRISRLSIEHENMTCCMVNASGSQETEDNGCTVDRTDDGGVAIISTGSSPSREVQHILFSAEVADEQSSDIPSKKKDSEQPAWPKIPIPEPENLCQNLTDMIRTNADKNSEVKSNVAYVNLESQWSSIYTKIELLETRVDQLTETISKQHHEIQQSVNLMNQYLMAQKDEKKYRNPDDRLFDESHIAAKIAQNVNSVISGEVEYAIKEEINGNVLPSLKNSMESFGHQLQLKMSQHINTADQQLKEYIVKTVHKKAVTDALCNSLGSVLPSVITNSFAEVFCNSILPKFEKSCHEMFEQVNNLFVDGTKEFINVLQKETLSNEEKQNASLQNKTDQTVSKINEVAEAACFNAFKSIEMKFVSLLKNSLDEQKLHIESCLLNAVNKTPQSHTTAAHKLQQMEHMEYLISQGKTNLAFEQVLSASDLQLLVCLCEKLDPDKVFSEPCNVEQHILLSFVQQLSVDLNIQTDLKHRFIESAIMCLDRKHPICEKHIPKILPAVRSRILQYINLNPNNKNTRNMKILLMAVDSLLADKNEHFPASL